MSRAYGPGSYDPAYEKDGQDYPVSYVRWTENRNMAEFLRLVHAGRFISSRSSPTNSRSTSSAAYQTILDPAAEAWRCFYAIPRRRSAAPPAPSCRDAVSTLPAGRTAQARSASHWSAPAIWRDGYTCRSCRRLKGVELRAVCSTSGAAALSYANASAPLLLLRLRRDPERPRSRRRSSS